jgi:hypothetical protein
MLGTACQSYPQQQKLNQIDRLLLKAAGTPVGFCDGPQLVYTQTTNLALGRYGTFYIL